MNEDLKVGDLVRVIRFNGGTGQIIRDRYGAIAGEIAFEVIAIECINTASPGKHLANIIPVGSSDEPITAQWDRLSKISTFMPELDMDLDEIHRAQALMEG